MSENKLSIRANALSVFSVNCLNMLSPLADCHTCETVCPQNALSFQNNNWTTVNCSLCGICAMVCPTQVFQIDQPYLLNLPPQELVLTCSQTAATPENAFRINCIQQLNPLALIHLLYRHPSLTIYLPIKQCEQCAHQWYAQGLIQQLSVYQIPADKLQIITDEYLPAAVENGRRELFRDLLHRTEGSAKKVFTQTVEKISADFSSKEITQETPAIFPTRLPLYALYIKQQLPLSTAQALPFRQLQCTNCTFCGACVHLCPTHALEIKEEDEKKSLLFHAELCINCSLCNTICMQHGLEWGEFMTAEQFMHTPAELAYGVKQICSQCSHDFYQWPYTAEHEAPICRFCKS